MWSWPAPSGPGQQLKQWTVRQPAPCPVLPAVGTQKQTNVGVGHPLSSWQPSKRHQRQLRPELTSHPHWQLPQDGDKSQAALPLRWEARLVSLRKRPQPLTQFLTNYPGKRSPRYRHLRPDYLERQTTGDRQSIPTTKFVWNTPTEKGCQRRQTVISEAVSGTTWHE